METPFKNLFKSGKIGNLTLKNRLIMSVFPAGFAKDSQVSEQMLEFYRARAKGGTALIVVESPPLNYPFDYKGGHQFRLDDDQFLTGLKKFLRALRQEGSKVFVQLSYPAKDQDDRNLTKTLTPLAIKGLVRRFLFGAKQARLTGFDGVEIQAAYGGLLSRFLSPASNSREDEYGGNLDDRARFLTGVIKTIREEMKDFPIQVKLVADEYLKDGFKLEEAKKVAQWLEEAGASSLLVSGGTKKTKKYSIPPYSLPSGVLVPLASEIKKKVGIPVGAMGKIKEPRLAEEILSQGKADFIGMTRALITDPDFPLKAAEGRVLDIRGCIACNECTVKHKVGPRRRCTVNPELGMEKEFKTVTTPAEQSKKIWIIGGGPSGLEAAIVTSQKGHQVELFEKTDRLGGIYNLASLAPHKKEVAELDRYLIHTVNQLPLKITLNREVTPQEIVQSKPDVVLIATGSYLDSPIPGSSSELVVDAHALWGRVDSYDFADKRVVIVGGGFVGCETAEMLADLGARVSIAEMLEDILLDMNKINRFDLLDRLQEKNAKVLTSTKVEDIIPNGVKVLVKGNSEILPADYVVLAITRKPNNRLFKEIVGKIEEVYLIGDALKVGNAGSAIKSAALTTLKI